MTAPCAVTPPLLHLSIDDVTACLRELAQRPHQLPWEQSTFAYLRDLHERAGIVVSLFVFERAGAWRLSQVPGHHRAEFESAATWLRFGFHGREDSSDYGSGGVPAARAGADYRRFASEVRRFAGAAAIDRLPRVHRFRGRLPVVRAWRDAPDGIRGLLSADDERAEVYYLDGAARERLRRDGAAFDGRERLHLVPSLPRLEGASDVARQLSQAAARPAARAGVPLCLFTHEPHLAGAHVRDTIAAAIGWARRRGAGYAFPADVLTSAQPLASRSAS